MIYTEEQCQKIYEQGFKDCYDTLVSYGSKISVTDIIKGELPFPRFPKSIVEAPPSRLYPEFEGKIRIMYLTTTGFYAELQKGNTWVKALTDPNFRTREVSKYFKTKEGCIEAVYIAYGPTGIPVEVMKL